MIPVFGFIFANTPPPEFNPDTVTPTVIGFLVTFFVAVATVLLAVDMARRIRRTTYRAQIKEKLEAEIAERDAKEGTNSPRE